MELLDILHHETEGKKPITQDRLRILCSNLSHIDEVGAKTVLSVIIGYSKKKDTVHKIGSVNNGIPYYGEEIPDAGVIFSAEELPDRLVLYLEHLVSVSDINAPDDDEDDDTLGFILNGASHDTKPVVPNTKLHTKFATVESRPGKRFDTTTTYEGYRIRIAEMGNVQFTCNSKFSTCYWDGEPFDDCGVVYPRKYAYLDGKHLFIGTLPFCSVFCLYAYISELRQKQKIFQPLDFAKTIQLTELMFCLMYPGEDVLRPAPQRESLDVYGGPYTITQFRQATCEKRLLKTADVRQEIQIQLALEL
jgi:hypothetical protein